MNKQSGFTLLELLIVAAVFSVIALISVDLFFTIAKIQKRVTSIQKVESDARFTIEAIAREARMGMVDYDYYGVTTANPLSNPQTTLATRDQAGNLIVYKGFDSVIFVCTLGPNDDPTDPAKNCHANPPGNNWQQVTPSGIEITNLAFYITPTGNPFAVDTLGNYGGDSQPIVTIILQTKSKAKDQVGTVIANLETTISSRIYKR